MVYDPFGAATASGEEAQTRLISLRRPKLLDFDLRALEWSDSRKRRAEAQEPTPSPGSVAPRAKLLSEKRTHEAPPDPQPGQVERQAVRVVEKEVFVEPVSIFGGVPLVDDRIRTVVNFILEHVNSPEVEVEAKLGFLFETQQNMRAIHLVPVTCETPISKESNKDTRFISDVGEAFFQNLNEKLNRRVEETERDTARRVDYIQTKEIDVMWPGRVRETRALKPRPDGREEFETIRVQTKRRLGDLNMLCPGRVADIRYSASSETNADIPFNSRPTRQRTKDRLSYKYESLSIDITSVETLEGSNQDSSRTHEVEVEIDQTANLYDEVMKYQNGDASSKLFEIATEMVNTVRLLLEE